MCFILSDLKCYGSTTSSFRGHLWSAKEEQWWKNNKKKNKLFTLQNVFLFLFIYLFIIIIIIFKIFFSLDPSYFQIS